MIKKLYLKSFRSILEQNIELQPLTVIVGANNSGKSNLIKSLDFIGSISRIGLNESVRKRNGFREILPKMIQENDFKKTNCEIKINFDFPSGFQDVNKALTCEYELSFTKGDDGDVKINTERTTLKNILWFTSKTKKLKKIYQRDSSITIEISKNKNIKSLPLPTRDNIDLFLDWMFPCETFGNIEAFKRFGLIRKKQMLTDIFLTLLKTREKEKISLDKPVPFKELIMTEKNYDTIFNTIFSDISTYFLNVKVAISRINRYDFSIDNLKSEQSKSNNKILDSKGNNLPSVLEKIRKENEDSWKRILETLSTISPLIKNAYPKDIIQKEKQYVEFEEKFGGRPIESWESSDGTLRTLSILLALESQEPYGIVLIEEPETGLHPWALKYLISFMRDLIERKKIQIILTTHSDQVLENAKRDEVLICSRTLEKGTIFQTIKDISPLSEEDMKDIGRKWRQGLLGGVPECV